MSYLNSIVSLRIFGPENMALDKSDLNLVNAAVESLVKIGLKAQSIAALKRLSKSGLTDLSRLARQALLQVTAEQLQLEEFHLELTPAEGKGNESPTERS